MALLVVDRVIRGNALLDPIHTFHAVGIVLVLILMWSRSRRVHGIATGITAAVVFAFVLRHTLTIE